MLDAIGPWIASIGPLPLLFIALVRGWLLTPAAVQKVHESQEARIAEMRNSYEARIADKDQQTQDWKHQATEAIQAIDKQGEQFELITELSETSLKLLEAVHSARFGNAEAARNKTTHVIRPGREN